MSKKDTFKYFFAGIALSVATNYIDQTFERGHLTPLVDAVGVAYIAPLIVPLSTTILLRYKAKSSE